MTDLTFAVKDNSLVLTLDGDYIHTEAPAELYDILRRKNFAGILVDAQKLKTWDSSLLVLLFKLKQEADANNRAFKTQNLPQGIKRMLDLAFAVPAHQDKNLSNHAGFLDKLGTWGINTYQTFSRGIDFAFQNISVLFRYPFDKTAARKTDFLFSLQECGPKAIGIVSLISFMVGLILAFVGAIQLKTFGAQIYVASLVTIGMIRIMGAIMAGIIMAGRTGASFAATIGTMQVNEEIDALKTMGISISEFLVLPRLAALVLSMPILTMWADFMGMLGGGFVGVMLLDIPVGEYWRYSWQAWSMTNFWVGIFHGFVFGFIIALCGCYYGINSGRNADGVGVATTKAVVSGIVWMIIATGFITFIFERLGI